MKSLRYVVIQGWHPPAGNHELTSEILGLNIRDASGSFAGKGALPPAHDLLARTDASGHLADLVVVIEKGVQQLGARGLGGFLAVVTTDALEGAALVLGSGCAPALEERR
ncbi:hypothetical protein D9M70_278970 [compost metagenome]